ncbi:hypothetical protein [Nostoc sp. LPT]|uniref:hypothetical protein n=1 Tax=Nostoc sp. LPT TaxID=2815387 RepID=UPI001D54A313|nr:hypothetical protein [Nostoc sp. LPT]MBN4004427.1 hypothetical protein [Nostoc sp. LPT]
MNRFEFQITMLQQGAEELEKKIANFTVNLLQIKTAAIAIWTATMGWSFSIKSAPIILVGYVVIISFWFLEAFYWRVQYSCIRKASVLTEYLNNQKALDESFENESMPEGLVYPLQPLKSEPQVSLSKALRAPSLAIFYGLLLVATSTILVITNSVK